jgi:hypothetical protein
VDPPKYEAIRIKQGMDADEMIYAGEQAPGAAGPINSLLLAPPNGSSWDGTGHMKADRIFIAPPPAG